jgi:hypothetical protein
MNSFLGGYRGPKGRRGNVRNSNPWWPVYVAIAGMAGTIFFAGKYADALLATQQTAHVAPAPGPENQLKESVRIRVVQQYQKPHRSQ